MKKLLEKYGKKKVYAGIGGVTVLALAIIVGAVYMINENKEKLIIKNEVVKVELGEDVSLKPSDYLAEEMSKENVNSTTLKSDLLTNTEKYTVDEEKQTVKTKDKDYLEVGKYKVTLSLNKEIKDVTVEVADTTAPVFKDLKKEIKIEQNAEDVDYAKYFKADDLSKVKIKVDAKKVDLAKVGEYEVEVTATDAYDNKTTEKAKIIVVDADKADEVTETNDGEKPISAETKKKKEEQAKVEQEQANTGGNASNGGSTNGGSSGNNGGGSTPTPAPAPQPNGIGAVINTAYSFVGRSDMTCADLVIQAYSQNGYDVPYGSAYYMGTNIGSSTSVLQAGDLVFTSGDSHVALVVAVNGSEITVIEGGINGNNVVTRVYTATGNGLSYQGFVTYDVSQIRRY